MGVMKFKPTPVDDRTPTGFFDAGNQNLSADDDNLSIPPALPRLFSRLAGGVLSSFYPSLMTLDGPHFRVGYFSYRGVQNPAQDLMQHAESDSTIGRPLRMRPPTIPRNSTNVRSVRDALIFVQSMPYETWEPIIPPPVSRR